MVLNGVSSRLTIKEGGYRAVGILMSKSRARQRRSRKRGRRRDERTQMLRLSRIFGGSRWMMRMRWGWMPWGGSGSGREDKGFGFSSSRGE